MNAVPNGGSVTVVGAGAQGVSSILTGSNFDDPQFIAFDGANEPWISNFSNGSITWDDRSNGNTLVNYTAGGTLSGSEGIAVDGSGNVWVANTGNNTVSEVIGVGAPVVTPLQAALNAPYNDPASKP